MIPYFRCVALSSMHDSCRNAFLLFRQASKLLQCPYQTTSLTSPLSYFSTDSSLQMVSTKTQVLENSDNCKMMTQTRPDIYQNVVVMRHGDRLDNFNPSWITKTSRPWDPPLFEKGRVRAFSTGRTLRNTLGFPIHRVFVSPFLRCIETASQVVSALSAINDDPDAVTGDGVLIDPSKLKVSVEYGLCEMMNRIAIRSGLDPKDGNWGFDTSQCEAMLPSGSVDADAARVYKELPQWGETVLAARARYAQVFKDLADKYPTENLLLVTHGEGVGVSISAFWKDATVYEVEYCAYSHLTRPIFKIDQSFTAGNFDVLPLDGETGVRYSLSSIEADSGNQVSK